VSDPDLLPSLRELGDRLGDAARREIDEERHRARPQRRGPRWGGGRVWLTAAVVGALVGAGGVTATEVFVGDGSPVPDEPSRPPQAGVLADSAAADPGGALPWALRVFGDEQGRECFQLGRLRGGRLGMVEGGQFRPFGARPAGPCGDLDRDPLLFAIERREQPAPRVIVYGLSRGDGAVRVRVNGRSQRIRPGALGSYVAVFGGSSQVSSGEITTTADGRPVTRALH